MSIVTDLQDQVVELKQSVADLQTTVDAHEASDAAVVSGLNQQIAALQAQIAETGSPEELQAVIAGLEEIKASVEASKEDIANGQDVEPSGTPEA